jgi:hypothetical protein
VEWFGLLVVEWVEEINAVLIHLKLKTFYKANKAGILNPKAQGTYGHTVILKLKIIVEPLFRNRCGALSASSAIQNSMKGL